MAAAAGAGPRARSKEDMPFEASGEDLGFDLLQADPIALEQQPDQGAGTVRITPLPTFPSLSKQLAVVQDAREGCGGHLWHAALALCRHLERWPDAQLAGRRVLELGAGTGLVGMYLARRGAEVLLTDLPVMQPVLERNVRHNFVVPDRPPQTAVYSWGTPLAAGSPLGGRWDVVVAADCVYIEAAFEPLLASLLLLAPDRSTVVLVSYQHRRKADTRFFRRLMRHFEAERSLGPNEEAPGAAGGPSIAGDSSKVQILTLRRRADSTSS